MQFLPFFAILTPLRPKIPIFCYTPLQISSIRSFWAINCYFGAIFHVVAKFVIFVKNNFQKCKMAAQIGGLLFLTKNNTEMVPEHIKVTLIPKIIFFSHIYIWKNYSIHSFWAIKRVFRLDSEFIVTILVDFSANA